MTELNVEVQDAWQRVLRLDPVPELELMSLPHTAYDFDGATTSTRSLKVDVELGVARIRSATTSSSTWSLTATSSSSSTTSGRKTKAAFAGGGRRHHVSKDKALFLGGIDTPRNQSSTSLPSSSPFKPAKIYTAQQLRLLTAEAAPSAYAPGGGRRHHAPQKKVGSGSTKPPKQANPRKLSSPSSAWARSPKSKSLHNIEELETAETPLSGVTPPVSINTMTGDFYRTDSRSSVLQQAPTQFAVIPLAPRKYSTWHYGIRVQVLQRPGSSASAEQSISPNFVEYEIWRRWEDCLDLQHLIEREYASAATEQRVFLAEQNHRKNNAGLFRSQRAAASFDSLPSGSDPLSVSRDVHNHLPMLSKKPKKLPSHAPPTTDQGTEPGGSGGGGKLTKSKRPFFKTSVGSSNTQALVAQARAEEFAAFLTVLFHSENHLLERVRGTTTFRAWFGWWRRDRDSLARSTKEKSLGVALHPTRSIKRGSTSTSSNNNIEDPHPSGNGKGKEREVLGMSANFSSEVVATSLPSSRANSPIPTPILPASAEADRPSSGPSSPHSSDHRYSGHHFSSQQQQQINPYSRPSLAPLTLLSSFPLPPQVSHTNGQSSPASATSPATSGNVTTPSGATNIGYAPPPSFVAPVVNRTPPPIPLHSHPNARGRCPPTRSSSLYEGAKVKRPHTAPGRPDPPSSGFSPVSQLPPPLSSSVASVPLNRSELHPSFLPSDRTAISRPPAMGPDVEIGRNMRRSQHQHRLSARRPATATGAQPTTMYQPRRQTERLSASSLKDALEETLGGFPMPPSSLSPMVANIHGPSPAVRGAEEHRGTTFALEQFQQDGLGRTTSTDPLRHEGMGLPKSRSMMHLNSGAVTTQNDHSHPRPYATSSVSARTTNYIPPESHVSPPENVRQYASADDFDGVEDDLMQIIKSSRRAHSQSPRPHPSGPSAIGAGAHDGRAPDLRHGQYQQHHVESPMLEKSEEDRDDEQSGRKDVALPEEIDDDDHMDTIRNLSEILLGTMEDPLQSIESSAPPATLRSHQQPTMSARLGSKGHEYADELGILRNDRSPNRPRNSLNPEHRHARFFRYEEKAWDDRFSTILPKEHHVPEDEEQQHTSGPLAPVAELSPRLSGGSEDGGSSMRIRQGAGSVMRDNDTISPVPLCDAHAMRTQHSLGGDEADSLTGADSLEGSSRPPSVAARRPRGLDDGNTGHVTQHSFSSVMTNATSPLAQDALILSRSHSMKYTAQALGRSGSPSLPPTSPSADKLRRRMSESSIRNTLRKLTTLDFFTTATPLTSSPLTMTRLQSSPPGGNTDDSRSSICRPSSERPSSDWARLRSQSPSSFASSSRGEWNSMSRGISRSLSLLDRRVRAESDASERSAVSPPEDNSSEQDGRHTPASDALAHYFECFSGSDSASMSQNGRLSSSSTGHALGLVLGSASSSISLGSPLRTPIGDESPIHAPDKAQDSPTVDVVSQKAVHRDSVTSIASPTQFPRPFQNRPAGQFHLPWSSTLLMQSRPTPTPLTTIPVNPAYPTNSNPSQHVSTKVVHAPSGAAVMLRLPRQISLQDLTEKVCAKFRDAADLDLVWDGFLIPPTSESDSLSLYYRRSLGGACAPHSPHMLRSRSGSVSSVGTSHDGSSHTFLRINSEDELFHILGSIPAGEKLVLRLVTSGQEA